MRIDISQVKNEADFAICMAIRMEVFVFEQNVPAELEWDAFDKTATHFFARIDGKPAATARLRRDADGAAKIERMAVRASQRGQHVGETLLQHVLGQARSEGYAQARVSAQTHAIAFYEKLGFAVVSEEYQEAGIPHKRMERPL